MRVTIMIIIKKKQGIIPIIGLVLSHFQLACVLEYCDMVVNNGK